jgi:mannose-6-phosphate isomerase-like protein (cupin superfamily)
MSSTMSSVGSGQDTFWWNGGLMEIKARAEDTGGALGVMEGRFPYEGYGTPLHVHSREDEAMYVLEGQIRFRVGDEEFVAGPGTAVRLRGRRPAGRVTAAAAVGATRCAAPS